MFVLGDSKMLAVVTLFGLLAYAPSRANDDFSDKGCHTPADIVFVLDESGSIWGPHFTKQLEFVQNVVDSFDVRPGKAHIGVVTYADEPRVIFHLGQHNTEAAIKDEIKAIKQMRGETYTNEALRLMRTELFSPSRTRPGIPHICIVITDGESNIPEETAKQAALAHQDGIQIFAVGVGSAINKDELRAIASSEDLVFEVNDYGALDGLKQLLALKACQVTTLPPPTTTTTTTTPAPPQMIEGCTGYKPMDHIWSIPDLADPEENNLALNLIRDVTSEMRLGPDRVQVGLSPRQCQTGPGILLKEYDTVGGLSQGLDGRRFNNSANTHTHLTYIRTKGMTAESGARPGATKFGILIVDSQHGSNLARTRSEAKKAKDAGIKLIVIGVGQDVDQSELSSIATSADDALTASSYQELGSIKSDVIARLCHGLKSSSFRQRYLYMRRFLDNYEDE